MTDPEISPCIGVCLLDPHGFCIGCGRTIDQIIEAGIRKP